MKDSKTKMIDIVTLKISLVGYWPEIWRTFRVPADISLPSLHEIVQVVMGWTNTHLHEFSAHHQRFADPTDDDMGDDALDSRTVALSHLVQDPGDEVGYEYDLGDGWEHRLVATNFSQGILQQAECLAGEKRCPPEDVGGVSGFRDFLKAIEDPTDEEHETWVTWCGGSFDANEFSVEEMNADLKRCKLSTKLLKGSKRSLKAL